MAKNFNFNYAFVFYDVNEKRVNKVFKVCKKYFHHHQNSVFRGAITPSKLIKLKSELNKIVEGTDFVTIIKLINDSCFDEETLGVNVNNTENLIL
ncbi:MAG: CRISPR-associated endonuclease Cas2 [Clostridium sp.]|jgi:CRISPR-associated protein Cas2|uniref:CRISPR-associated endonuclease Cas2 n=1 Tax=Clostridium sp. TaxID=1506 RepID=UPI0025BE956B|nr:CRISPR-associated endonuclease Cas2 [Clostridium sp.]MCH3963146.1 CRISPR-associated endonuclease Cas2 [Clostridium sp.]MCI1716391.1 CRISPR-associated endonuclease Cas2 [Clostridium sp.]MCI1800731.1 CRISPR-associated endonuclease Cas2 [Clostridium sp.]MCI1814614.1 CRISPR-associated endonuclease Cas2 [Clostridium sp.]MCI1871524.1 CRISPR-associated endonuclease Cas2 [Clostridium sp.]